MLDILTIIPGKKRHHPTGWWSFNAICCHHRGHKVDKRGRGGVIYSDQDAWSYSCFNCGFKCGARPGKHFSGNTKSFLSWCGVDSDEIDKLSFQCFAKKTIYDIVPEVKSVAINFESRLLPEKSVRLDSKKSEHEQYVKYLFERGLSPDSYQYYVTPDTDVLRDRERIIIPYYWKSEIVGYTSRYYDGRKPKYVSEQQRGYVFNVDAQKREWSVCLLVEGQFDAISIDGCAYLGSTILDEQARLLSSLGKKIIVVPDRDKTGMSVCDKALELGYSISIPEWADDVKDANDAVRKYGKLGTIMSILQAATHSKITVEMNRRKFK